MQVDFFVQGGRTTSMQEVFGLCDVPPACIDEENSDRWIAVVRNRHTQMVEFYAIDGCVTWHRADGSQAKACDGMLAYNTRKNVVFVELKDRNPRKKQWRINAEEQLKSTIECFRANHDAGSVSIRAYTCNRQTLFDVGEAEHLQRFKEQTGITLRVCREIVIG